jgi:hypothetical protein
MAMAMASGCDHKLPLAPLAPRSTAAAAAAAPRDDSEDGLPIANELQALLTFGTAAPPLRRVPKERRVVGGGGGGGGAASAPLAQRSVGGVLITKSKPSGKAAIADLPRLQREVRREAVLIARAERQHAAVHTAIAKHRDRDRDESWAKLRIRQTRIVVQLFACESDGAPCGPNELINESASTLTLHLCRRAAFQATREPNSRRLPTASAAFWAIVLVQEAWCRCMNGDKWEVATKERRERLSFGALEEVYDQSKGDRHLSIEHHQDEAMAHKMRAGVPRRICSHSLGNKKDKLAKIQCLDALLKRSGDRGLHPHIVKLWQPLVVRLPKPAALGVQGAARQFAVTHHRVHGDGSAA